MRKLQRPLTSDDVPVCHVKGAEKRYELSNMAFLITAGIAHELILPLHMEKTVAF